MRDGDTSSEAILVGREARKWKGSNSLNIQLSDSGVGLLPCNKPKASTMASDARLWSLVVCIVVTLSGCHSVSPSVCQPVS